MARTVEVISASCVSSWHVVLQPSLTGHSRVVTHDVPVGVVPRRLWNDFAEPEMPDFDVCKASKHSTCCIFTNDNVINNFLLCSFSRCSLSSNAAWHVL